MEIESSNPRAVIMELVKEKFKHLLAWDRMEAPIALLCSEIPEATNEKQKEELIKSLKKIKNYLKEQGINLKELTFLDEEIERYAHTKQISLYKEKDDVVPTEIIEKYSRLSYGNEGIVGIHLNYNYEQLRKLTNGVYRKTKEIIFYISREKTIYGKIVAEIFEHPQQIPIATLLERKTEDQNTGQLTKRVALFGEKINYNTHKKLKEINADFYMNKPTPD